VWAAQLGIQKMRRAVFDHLLRVNPPLFTKHSASSLTNIVVYEVQSGAQQLVYSVLVLVKDTLVFIAMSAYLIYSNWRVTLLVVLMVPGVAFAIRLITPRLRWMNSATWSRRTCMPGAWCGCMVRRRRKAPVSRNAAPTCGG
jgi:subfamily B ATP-binding cassette protein MsbA